jgi:octaprenyl-diphosphate synthase
MKFLVSPQIYHNRGKGLPFNDFLHYNTDMNSQYIERLEKIEAVMRKHLPEHLNADWMKLSFDDFSNIVPLHLAETLTKPNWDLVTRGGKRWRPLLMTLVCEMLGGGDSAIPLTPLVEFPHNASLIHDDIEDNSDERRGKPAVHLLYGMDTAINSGCFLYFLPTRCIDAWNAPAEKKLVLYQIWSEYLRRLHLGQAMDIAWHRNVMYNDTIALPSIDEYLQMCKLKTGVLARMSAVCGVHVAGNSVALTSENDICNYLGSAAENLGVGFQILDDVKNLTTGNPGKKRGDDIVEGKNSLPVLFYLHEHEDKREAVYQCFQAAKQEGITSPKVEELISMLDASGSIEKAKAQGLALIKESEDILKSPTLKNIISKNDEAFNLLAGFADMLR